MPILLDLFTVGDIMEAATLHAASSEATGHPGGDALDYRLNTYWEPTSSGVETIDIDLGSAKSVNGLAFWIHNYTNDFDNGSSDQYRVDWSDNGSAWTPWNSLTAIDNNATDPIYFAVDTTAISHRYWRLIVQNMANGPIEISQIFLFKKYSIAQGPQLPYIDGHRYFNEVNSVGGHSSVYPVHSSRVDLRQRQYTFVSGTAKDDIRDAHRDCRGTRFPLIALETATATDARVFRFASDSFLPSTETEAFHNVDVTFIEVPHIIPGNTF